MVTSEMIVAFFDEVDKAIKNPNSPLNNGNKMTLTTYGYFTVSHLELILSKSKQLDIRLKIGAIEVSNNWTEQVTRQLAIVVER